MKTNSLTTRRSDVAAEINRLHGQILASFRLTVKSAIRIGELLTEQKAKLGHGRFLPWIEKHLPFTDRTARNYMSVYASRDALKSETVSDLTDAYRLLQSSASVPCFVTMEQREPQRIVVSQAELVTVRRAEPDAALSLTCDAVGELRTNRVGKLRAINADDGTREPRGYAAASEVYVEQTKQGAVSIREDSRCQDHPFVKSPSSEELAAQIADLIGRYQRRYPEITTEDVISALNEVTEEMEAATAE